MGYDYYLCPLVYQFSNGGEALNDSIVVGNLLSLMVNRRINIHPEQYRLTLVVKIIQRQIARLCHWITSLQSQILVG